MTASLEHALRPRRTGRVLVVDDHAANRLLLRNISVVGVGWGAWLSGDSGLFATTVAGLQPMIESGGVAPMVGAAFPLEDAVSALRLIDERRATGKVVLTV